MTKTKSLKRILLAVALLITCIVSLFACGGNSEDDISKDTESTISKDAESAFSWELLGDVLTISGKGAMPDYDDITGDYPEWSESKDDIKKVIIEDGITTIGNYVFSSLDSLEEIVIPNSVTSIGESAFYECKSLVSVTIPDSVTSIGDGAFNDCSSLESLIIPDSVTSIGESAFYECKALKNITIPNSVTSIGKDAFKGCESIKSFCYSGSKSEWNTISIGLDNESLKNADIVFNNNAEGSRGTLEWNITDGVLTISGEGDMPDFNHTNRPGWHALRRSIKKVIIEEGITSVGESAFGDCRSLVSVTIPNGVTSIGDGAFSSCYSLKSINIPDSVTSIGESAFVFCYPLKNVTIPDSVTSIGDYAFNWCSSLVSITIPDSVTYIGDGAFSGCYKLAEVINHSSLKIEKGADDNGRVAYNALEVHNGPSKIVKIDDYSFYPLSQNNVYLIDYLGNDTEINLPKDYNGKSYKINDYAFLGCDYLVSVTIPNGVMSIGQEAFGGCYKLAEVINLSSLKIEKGSDDNGCVALSALEVHDGPSKIVKIDDYSFYPLSEDDVYLIAYHGKDAEISLPKDCNGKSYKINALAFYDCNNLVSVTIPNGVTYIGEDAFKGCSSLASITIPDSVTSVGDWAFSHCSSLTSITIPKNVTSIGESAFESCERLIEVINHSSLYIEKGYRNNGCVAHYALDVHSGPSKIVTVGDFSFYLLSEDDVYLIAYHGKDAMISLPKDYNGKSYSINRVAFLDCDYLVSVTIPNGVTSIGSNAFDGCSSLTSITIPNSVTSIEYYAFSSCSSLTSITIPNSVTSVGDWAFTDCSSLTSITIPNSVTSVGDGVFNLCSSLVNVTIPDSVTFIGGRAFSYCSSLVSITIPDSVTSIRDEAFSGCSSLKSISIPNSVTSVGEYAFYYCTSLTSITLPDSITSIRNWTFGGCISLTGITIPDSVTSIKDYAFYTCTSLVSITIPDGVTSIGRHAFYGCRKLVEIINYSSLKIEKGSEDNGHVAAWAFEVHSEPSKIITAGDFVYYPLGEDDVYLIAYHGKDAEISLPKDYNGKSYKIKSPVFSHCTSLENVIIPDGVTSIGSGVFSNCTSLESVTIPDSVTSIGKWAFENCISLKTVYFGGSKSEWDSIFKGEIYFPLAEAEIIFNHE